jgi:hypothetical protein
MSLKELSAELRRRGVLKVAVAYIATGFVLLEGLTHLFHNFEAPHWVLKVITALLIIGLPIACLMAWGFEFKDGVVRPVPSAPTEPGDAQPTGRSPGLLWAGLLLVALLAGVALVQWRTPSQARPPAGASTPVVIIMDTGAPHGVYDQDLRDAGGTNADALTDTLRDLPIVLQKETVGATWAREDQILKQHPNLILIHRSSFFHSMNQEFGFGYPGEPGFDEARVRQLYAIAQNKLMAFLGYVGQVSPDTLFLVYGRGTGGDWESDRDRAEWVEQVVGRFPALQGRVTTLGIPGGVAGGSMRDEMTQELFQQQVRKLLELDGAVTAPAAASRGSTQATE